VVQVLVGFWLKLMEGLGGPVKSGWWKSGEKREAERVVMDWPIGPAHTTRRTQALEEQSKWTWSWLGQSHVLRSEFNDIAVLTRTRGTYT
jgi:hypothetical protein